MTRWAVRAAKAGDFAEYARLMQVLMGPLPVRTGPDGAALFARILAQHGTTVFVAEAGGALGAVATLHVMANLTHDGRPYALIENVVSDPALRGQGLGRAVMMAACDHAWAQEAYKIMLLTGVDNGARGFYETLGFSATDKTGLTLRRAPRRTPPES